MEKFPSNLRNFQGVTCVWMGGQLAVVIWSVHLGYRKRAMTPTPFPAPPHPTHLLLPVIDVQPFATFPENVSEKDFNDRSNSKKGVCKESNESGLEHGPE